MTWRRCLIGGGSGGGRPALVSPRARSAPAADVSAVPGSSSGPSRALAARAVVSIPSRRVEPRRRPTRPLSDAAAEPAARRESNKQARVTSGREAAARAERASFVSPIGSRGCVLELGELWRSAGRMTVLSEAGSAVGAGSGVGAQKGPADIRLRFVGMTSCCGGDYDLFRVVLIESAGTPLSRSYRPGWMDLVSDDCDLCRDADGRREGAAVARGVRVRDSRDCAARH